MIIHRVSRLLLLKKKRGGSSSKLHEQAPPKAHVAKSDASRKKHMILGIKEESEDEKRGNSSKIDASLVKNHNHMAPNFAVYDRKWTDGSIPLYNLSQNLLRLGKEAFVRKNIASMDAAEALEEALATESIIRTLRMQATSTAIRGGHRSPFYQHKPLFFGTPLSALHSSAHWRAFLELRLQPLCHSPSPPTTPFSTLLRPHVRRQTSVSRRRRAILAIGCLLQTAVVDPHLQPDSIFVDQPARRRLTPLP